MRLRKRSKQMKQLICRQSYDPKHQMRHDLCRATHSYKVPAVRLELARSTELRSLNLNACAGSIGTLSPLRLFEAIIGTRPNEWLYALGPVDTR